MNELLPVLDQKEAQKVLMTDFFHSFAVAQGDPTVIQTCLFELLREKYIQTWGEPLDVLRSMHSSLTNRVVNFQPPKGHSQLVGKDGNPLPAEKVSGQFGEVWKILGYSLEEDPDPSPNQHQALGSRIASRDLTIMERGGRRSTLDKDPFKSFYRQHVLLGETFHSPRIDAVMADVRSVATTRLHREVSGQTNMNPLTPSLMGMWKLHHPDDQFYPDDLAHLTSS